MARRKPRGGGRDAPRRRAGEAPPESDDDSDADGIRRWIDALALDSLLDAAEFAFEDREGDEARLFSEMISARGDRDGDGASDRGGESNRRGGPRSKPHVFRWVPRRSDGAGGAGDPRGARQFAFAAGRADRGAETEADRSEGSIASESLPAELLLVLKEAGVRRSVSSLIETYNRPEGEGEGSSPPRRSDADPPREDGPADRRLEARRLATADGVWLGVGATAEQIDADDFLLLRTAVVADGGSVRGFRLAAAEGDRKSDVLRALRAASRGRFLARRPADRFDPRCWHSLPAYLAGGFERALRRSHRRRRRGDPPGGRAAPRAVGGGEGIRTGGGGSIGAVSRGSLARRAAPGAAIPLLEWGTPRSELAALAAGRLEESLAAEARRDLLEMLEEEGDGADDAAESKKKGRRKKKRKKKKQPVVKTVEERGGDSEEEEEEEEDLEVECILHGNREGDGSCGELHAASAEPDENDAKIAALVVIDDVLDDVFRRVGFREEDDATTSETERQALPGKGSVGDDAEQATTTVASNKASVHAAVTFLKRRDDVARSEAKSPPQSQQLWASRSKQPPKSCKGADIKRSRSKDSFEPHQPIGAEHRASSAQNIKDNPEWESNGSDLFPQIAGENIFDGAPLCLSGALDRWNGVACPRQNPSDILTDLLKPEERTEGPVLASSTAASLASSEAEDPGLDIDEADGFRSGDDSDKAVRFESFTNMARGGETEIGDSFAAIPAQSATITPDSPMGSERSTTPPPPPTPPPQLSPILVSLADLTQLRKEAAAVESKTTTKEMPPKPPQKLSSERSLPDSSFATSAPLTRNSSRDDLRSIDERRRPLRRDKDPLHHSMGRPQAEKVNRNVDALLSYRNVVAQSVHRKHSHDGKQAREEAHIGARNVKPAAPRVHARASTDFTNPRSSLTSTYSPIINKVLHLDVACARSECAPDGVEDASHCNVIPRGHTDDTMTKDGATTISSVRSPPQEEPFANVKEERDAYRDLCLTLGAENAKLRNLIASKMCAPLHNPSSFYPEQSNPFFFNNPSFEFHFGAGYNPGSFHPVVAKSDAGVPRGEHESSARSEDGTEMYPSVIGMSETQNSMSWQARGDSVHSVCRRTSGGGTYAESDTSLEQNIGGPESHTFSAFRHINRQDPYFGPMPQSRLSRDIHQYMQALKTQLKRNESRRVWVVEQITKSVNTLWPRAQIKMYGSHMTGLCLPSSDMDFVICLPAVHKNAPARAPGDLEGRNAINETNQKVLSRKLKGESWLDQRSIKVIERTAVPVIKVSTKDSRSRVVQLDLSFDAKEHHGLEALLMIQHILEELPMIRPLVLVLKQFLLDRGLLTAYTGGMSSYCLFLMVARYCQEQSTTWNDCGSLLMGLLDFYGNFFDPRTTGISVGKRQYFSRSQDMQHTQPVSNQFFAGEQGWNMSPQQQYTDLVRRNSFSDKSFGSGGMPAPKPPRFQPPKRQFSLQTPYHSHAPQSQGHSSHEPRSYQSGKPYTFDPIWVEDPLNPGNNVGRNAFRIFQVQRAFSDAHRALVAALEWDINSVHEFGDDGEYPLLKCLLQNEDVFFDNMRD